MKTRIEHDLLGNKEVPMDAYYGVQTLRAIENFAGISNYTIGMFPNYVKALAMVKWAAAKANFELGLIPADITNAITAACEEIIDGKLADQFPVDMVQGGAGTSTNMNINEVVANRALELLGHQKGEYQYCHPNNHVNLSQSTNDAYPTSFHLAIILTNKEVVAEIKLLVDSFRRKAKEFEHVLKMGRTQLQDAVPMTLGQEFEAYAYTLEENIERLNAAAKLFLVENMGATAIGTGINSEPEYAEICARELRIISGEEFVLAPNLIAATPDTGACVSYSSELKRFCVQLSKVCNDLRLLSSGPRCGLNEINLPPMQPGSSIMPGKVNPVIPEVTNQAAFLAIGLDTSVMLAASAGQLELNVMEPVISFALYMQMKVLTNSCNALREKCIDGIVVNAKHCEDLVMGSLGIITVLKPHFGYKPCANIAREGFLPGKSLHQLVVEEKQMLTQEQWDKVFTYENLINPKFEK